MKYQKTSAGQQAFKDRSVPLSPRQRAAFILFDGQRSTAEVLAATKGLGVTGEDVDYLVGMDLLGPVAGAPVTAPAPLSAPNGTAPAALAVPPEIPPPVTAAPAGADRYRVAYPLAVQLAGTLGLRGYRLTLAVETAGSYDQLLALFPRIQDAVGAEKARALEQALRG